VDPCDFLEALLRSDRVPAADNFSVAANHGHLRSPAMDAALDRYRADRSAESLAGVVTRLNESAPLIPLMHGSAATVRSARVMRMKPSPLWYVPVEELDLKV
jgi:ABC-type oligopeptide transport system substrate-binding subunit